MRGPAVYRMLQIIKEHPNVGRATLADIYGCNKQSGQMTAMMRQLYESEWVNVNRSVKGHMISINDKGEKVLEMVASLEAME